MWHQGLPIQFPKHLLNNPSLNKTFIPSLPSTLFVHITVMYKRETVSPYLPFSLFPSLGVRVVAGTIDEAL